MTTTRLPRRLVLAVAGAAVIVAAAMMAVHWRGAQQPSALATGLGSVIGSPDAKVTFEVYGDFR